MDTARATELRDDWVARHAPEPPPAPAAREAVHRLLAERVPDPDAAVALLDAEGRRRVVVLAGGALFLVWAVPAALGTREAARCRRLPLEAGRTPIEISERIEPDGPIRYWWFELEDEPLVFRAGRAEEEAFARALAAALGWPE